MQAIEGVLKMAHAVMWRIMCLRAFVGLGEQACRRTMRFVSTAKVLLKCKLKYYKISE